MFEDLNPKQFEAVEHIDGPLLVLAGAGTGKTKVLTYRIANIIQKGKAFPNQILAVTFTNKAATEMRSRVESLIDAYGITLGTFHSICAKILRRHAEVCGLTPSFSIIDTSDQLRIIKESLLEANLDVKANPPKIIASIISHWKDLGLTPEKVSQADVKSPNHDAARRIYKSYQMKLVNSNAVDFGDLILNNVQIFLKNPDILEYYQDKYKYILVDEYQDTNPIQYLWTRMLATKHNNICCVGDDDQSIYSWRGAEIGNILKFEKDFKDAKIVKLEQNYRSTTPILKTASRLISHNKYRHGKELWTEGNSGEDVKVVYCWNDKEEARFVTSEMNKRSQSRSTPLSQMAILVRAGFQTRLFEEALISLALPYKIIGGLKFYDRQEIRDILAYIRCTLNHNDNIALERIINIPKRSIGNATLAAIKSYGSENNISTFDAIKEMLTSKLFKPKVHASLEEFCTKIASWKNVFEEQSLYDGAKQIIEESGYLDMLKTENSEESKSRIENLKEMTRAIGEFDKIEDFLEHASLVTEGDLSQKTDEAVNLMTVHAAKGLEFDLVFMPGLEEGLFPNQRSIAEEGPKGLEEERRLAYVGITRAKKELFISYAESRRMYNEFVNSLASRFIGELMGDNVQKFSSSAGYYKKPSYSAVPIKEKKISTIKRDNPFAPGASVSHQIFGNGIILKSDGSNIEVAFSQSGIKTLKKEYLELA